MSYPLSVVIRELENPDSIVPVLRSLHYAKNTLQSASKPELNHLTSRTLNLARSSDVHRRWCGINVIRVLCDDYTILAAEGNNLLQQLLKILESYNETIDRKIFVCVVDAINRVCDNIRGKPALTREILTPKLSSIIGLYLDKLHFEPVLIIQSLHRLIRRHPTTFRTYANKTDARLKQLIVAAEYQLPLDLNRAIMTTLASLPVVEKNEPELKWESNVRDIVREVRSVVEIYGEFLSFEEDTDLKTLMEKLPRVEDLKQLVFPPLAIDVNEPSSLYQLTRRTHVLLDMLAAYATTETQFSVKVPLGLLVTAIETVISVSTKFLKFKGDIRDQTIKDVVVSTLRSNHEGALKLMEVLCKQYGGAVVPYFSDILGFLEFVVPFRDRTVNYTELVSNESLFLQLLETVSSLLTLTENLGEASLLLRFVDVALILVEPRQDTSQTQAKTQSSSNPSKKNNSNKKKNRNGGAASLSDLLSHKNLFQQSIPSHTLEVVRRFFGVVISRVSLPPTQHYKVARYLIVEAVNARSNNQEHRVPEELAALLETALLNPGFESVSILPIVSSLLGDGALISLFNNPRFPPLPQYVQRISGSEPEEEDDEDEDEETTESLKRTSVESEPVNLSNKKAKINSELNDISSVDTVSVSVEPAIPLVTVETTEVVSKLVFQTPDADQVMLFASETIEQVETKPVEEIRTDPDREPVAVKAPAPIEVKASDEASAVDDDEESDFEMPVLDGGADSDDE